MSEVQINLTAKDYSSGQDVKWCPGCGDYSILAQAQKVFAELQLDKSNTVWVSGIGCSSRFIYYMGTYGFHSIHGRAPAIASGVKLHNPDLNVWVATGDGDLMSIGGNHFIHAMRRNIGLKMVLFNNRIYGLTKGQFSPTSEFGKKTKSSPYGSVDYPFNTAQLAIGANASFYARTLDKDMKHLSEMLKKAAEHKGTTMIEVLQNCVIFNDGAFNLYTDKETKEDNVLYLEHNKPMVFGKNNEKGIKLNGLTPEIIDISKGEYSINDVWVHDENDPNPARANIISLFDSFEGFPMPLGVYRAVERTPFEENIHKQIADVTEMKGKGTIKSLLRSSNSWEVI